MSSEPRRWNDADLVDVGQTLPMPTDRCPLCDDGTSYTACHHMAVDLIREIVRLRREDAVQWRDWQTLEMIDAQHRGRTDEQ